MKSTVSEIPKLEIKSGFLRAWLRVRKRDKTCKSMHGVPPQPRLIFSTVFHCTEGSRKDGKVTLHIRVPSCLLNQVPGPKSARFQSILTVLQAMREMGLWV